MPYITVRRDGSVNIPCAVRSKMGIKHGNVFEVRTNGKGQITLHPQHLKCSLCEATVRSVDPVTGTCDYCKTILTHKVRVEGMELSSAIKVMQKERRHKNY